MKSQRSNCRCVTVEIVSALFVLLFVYAALSKLAEFDKFQIQLAKSPVLNAFYRTVAIGVPAVEIVISVALLFKRTQFPGLIAAFTLMVIFTGYIIAILHFSDYIPCSCGGILQNMTWTEHLFFNIIFIMLAAFAVMLYQKNDEILIAQVRG